MFAGEARHPVMIALAETVETYSIPIGPFEALISAFEQDQDVAEYETYPQLLDYCERSANPVGHLVLYLGRSFDEGNARLSDRTCTALQLANFWQDVARDLAIGRIYLPREDRDRFGVTIDDLQRLAVHARRSPPCSGSRSIAPATCSSGVAAGGPHATGAGRGRGPVHARGAGDPGRDRGPRVRRAHGSGRASRS